MVRLVVRVTYLESHDEAIVSVIEWILCTYHAGARNLRLQFSKERLEFRGADFPRFRRGGDTTVPPTIIPIPVLPKPVRIGFAQTSLRSTHVMRVAPVTIGQLKPLVDLITCSEGHGGSVASRNP